MSATPTSIPRHDEIVRKAYGRIRDSISVFMRYSTMAIEDIIKPSMKTFLETCDTNPQVAAIVATPALLAILFTLAFLVLSTLILVIWTTISISLGIVFVVVGGLLSLSVKLVIVAIATLPLAGIATGLLIAGNYVAQFVTKELSISSENFTLNGENWQKIASTTFRESIRFASWASSALSTVWFATFSAVRTAFVVLHDAAERDTASPPNPMQASTSGERGEEYPAQEFQSINRRNEADIPSAGSFQEDRDSEVVFVEPITIPDAQSSNPNVKQRNPFKASGDDDDS